MAKCPNCQADLPEDFGLIECASCAAPLFVELDGEVRVSGLNPATPGISHPPRAFDLGEAEEGGESSEPPPLESSFMKKIDMRLVDDQGRVDNPEPIPMDAPEPIEVDADPTHAVAQEQESEEVSVSVAGLGDVAAYGNSEISRGQDGGLFYNLRIEGIDSSELRSLVKEILQDRKFLWDSEALMKSIRMGTLVLRDITPVKASLLVQRLHDLPLQLIWEQHAIHEA